MEKVKKLTAKDIGKHVKAATDKTIMPFGKHAGSCLAAVPASYLLWFYEQDWAEERYPAIYKYCKKNEEALYKDAEEEPEHASAFNEAWPGDWDYWK